MTDELAHLPPRERIARLYLLATEALAAYPLDVRRLRLLAEETNVLFRVDGADGRKHALRICAPGEHTRDHHLAEVEWLLALHRETDVNVAAPIANSAGEFITSITVPEVPNGRDCMLFEWVPGRPIEEKLSPSVYHQLGATVARLHNYAATYAPPEHLDLMRWDRLFYFPDEPVVVDDADYAHLFSAERRAIIEQVRALAEPLLRAYYERSEPVLIHADLHMWNVHAARGKLYLLDFEDLMWGHPAQDVAITLYYGQERHDYPALRAAFEEGYRSVGSWPIASEQELATLWAARRAMFANYVAHSDLEPQEYLDGAFEKLAAFLTTL